jgi:uncharacterized membrane protein YgdD (TMEM256/DUF423 family)
VNRDWLRVVACVSAAAAIMAGAFGAHGSDGPAVEWLKTGASYQLVHAVAVLVAGRQYPAPSRILLAGSLIFSLSLYALALGGSRWMGAIAPLGGSAMIMGWLWMAYRVSVSRNVATSANETDLSTKA